MLKANLDSEEDRAESLTLLSPGLSPFESAQRQRSPQSEQEAT